MNLPASSVGLSNGMLKLDARYCLQNCSILMPEINPPLNGTIRFKLDGLQKESIRGLNNDRTLNVTGIYLKVPDTAAILSPGTILAGNTELNVPDMLSAKDINLSLKNNTSKVVSGNISLGGSYIFFIRDAALNLPPGSVIQDESYLQRLNYSAASWNTKYLLPLASFSGLAESMFSWIVRVFALALGLWLLYILSSRFLELTWHKPRSLVVNSFAKTGIKEIDDSLDSLSQITRERLAESLLSLQGTIEKHAKEQGPGTFDIREFKPLPDSLKKKGLSDLVSSLKGANSGQSFPLLSFIDLSSVSNMLFPPKGIEVSCFPQRKGKDPEVLGISFKLSDLSEKQESVSFTYWEKEPVPAKKSLDEKGAKDLEDSIKCLENAVELKLARTYQKELLSSYCLYKVENNKEAIKKLRENKDTSKTSDEKMAELREKLNENKEALKKGFKKNKEDLRRLDEKILRLEVASNLFTLGKKLETTDPNGATCYYKKAFIESFERRDEGVSKLSKKIEKKWKNILSDHPDEYLKKDIQDIARSYWDVGLQKEAAEVLKDAEKRFDKDDAQTVSSYLNDGKISKARCLVSAAEKLEGLGWHKEAKEVIKKALDLSPDDKDVKKLSRKLDLIADAGVQEKVIQERYIELLKPATRWLAAEVSRFWMRDHLHWERSRIWNYWRELPIISKISNAERKSSQNEAAVHNFFGALYTAYGNKDPVWYDLAEADLKKACKLYEEWYLPHENLGFLYSIKGLKEKNDKKMKELISKAVVEYQRALTEREASLSPLKKLAAISEKFEFIRIDKISIWTYIWFGLGCIIGLSAIGLSALMLMHKTDALGGTLGSITGVINAIAEIVKPIVDGIDRRGILLAFIILCFILLSKIGGRYNWIIGHNMKLKFIKLLNGEHLPDKWKERIIIHDPEEIEKRIRIGMAIAYYYMDNASEAKKEAQKANILIDSLVANDILKKPCKGCESIIDNENALDVKKDAAKAKILNEALVADEIFKKSCKDCLPNSNSECLKIKSISRIIRRYNSPRYIYNQACYYALMAKRATNKDLKNGLNNLSSLLLAISLALDRIDGNLISSVQDDPDLDEVAGSLSECRLTLLLNLARNGDNLSEKRNELADILCPAFKKIIWEKQPKQPDITLSSSCDEISGTPKTQ